jgi:hypothetical protein
MKRVRVGSEYTYQPAGLLDRCSPASTAQAGQRVRVVNLRGCPPANTMGHCHIEDLDGNLLGLVSTHSLQK